MISMTRKKILVHTHHISTHFTNGLFPAAALMITLFLYTGDPLFESTAFHCIAIGFLGIPFAYLSGVMDWKKRFQGRRTRTFDHKIAFGLLFLILGAVTFFIRWSYGEEINAAGAVKLVYVALIYILTGLATYLGHLGSKFI